MRAATPLQNFARRLLALEASSGKTRDTEGSAAFRVCEKLRQALSTFAGVAVFDPSCPVHWRWRAMNFTG